VKFVRDPGDLTNKYVIVLSRFRKKSDAIGLYNILELRLIPEGAVLIDGRLRGPGTVNSATPLRANQLFAAMF
jgi:hypothetical protein